MTAAVQNGNLPPRPHRPPPPGKLAGPGEPVAGAEPPPPPRPPEGDDHLTPAPDEENLPSIDNDVSEIDLDEAAMEWVEGNAVDVIPGDDPFTSTMSLIAESEQLGVWVRLTPPAIQAITAQLGQVLALQQQALGLFTPIESGHHETGGDENGDNPDSDEDEGDQPREGMIRRVRDPLGLRFIPARSSRAVWYVAAAVLLLAVAAAVLAQGNL